MCRVQREASATSIAKWQKPRELLFPDDANLRLRYLERPVHRIVMSTNEPSFLSVRHSSDPSTPPPLSQRQVLSPTQLVGAARELLERGFPLLWLEGELSNFVRSKPGHLYFTLKDAGAQVRCAMFRPRAMHVRFAPVDGQKVLIRARVTLYEPRGDFQLQVEHMEEAGLGALQRAFDELKTRLSDEGLFALERKRALPALPRRIAVVTSATGAAIRDVLSVLARRFPLLEVDIFPSLVQGNEARSALRNALAAADKSRRYDVILLTRGGGSIEDLWAFNDEALARAIHASLTPVVSAVGHEIDFTIADFVADLRAPTPSAAAELIVPDQQALLRRVMHLHDALRRQHARVLERKAQRCDATYQRLQARHPLSHLGQQQQRMRHAGQRLRLAAIARLRQQQSRLEHAHTLLIHHHPATALRNLSERALSQRRGLQAAVATAMQRRTANLLTLARTLNVLNPLATLERGYAIAFDTNRKVVRDAQSLRVGEVLSLRLATGSVQAEVRSIDGNAPS
jgi:exodeoxyribonuclease VII large subunit